jgi:hypothetical protein
MLLSEAKAQVNEPLQSEEYMLYDAPRMKKFGPELREKAMRQNDLTVVCTRQTAVETD